MNGNVIATGVWFSKNERKLPWFKVIMKITSMVVLIARKGVIMQLSIKKHFGVTMR